MSKLKQVGNNFIRSDRFIYALMRAGLVSQVAAWVDLFTGFALFAWCGLAPWLSTAIGATLGGVVNCVANFHFTFHAKNCPWKAVIVKYIMVWVGSLLLNSFGTEGLYLLLNKWEWLETIGFKPDGYYAAARLIVSGVVSLFWNILLQAKFVYRVTSFDCYAIDFVNYITLSKKRTK